MSDLVLMVKDGYTSDVHPDVVEAHIKAGWAVVKTNVARLSATLSTDAKALLHGMETRISDLEEIVKERGSDIELACETEAKNVEEGALAKLNARIAVLEAKKTAGQMERHEHPLLARLLTQRESLAPKA